MTYRLLALGLLGCGFQVQPQAGDASPAPGDAAHDAGRDAPPVGDAPSAIDAVVITPPDAPPSPVTGDFASTGDIYLRSLSVDENTNDRDYAIVDGDYVAVILLHFDVSALAPGSTITAAELHIWNDGDPGDPCTLHQVLESWDEATATYRSRATGVLWTAAGAAPPSRAVTAAGTFTPSIQDIEYVVPIDAAVVASWVAAPATNHGLALVTANANGSRFSTREAADATRRPYLRVTHLP